MKNITLPLVGLLFLLLCSESASACWCRREALDTEKKFKAAVAKELRQSAVVFAGEAVERNRSGLRFRVERVWKGEAADEIVFRHEGESFDGREYFIDSCALLFEVGKKYLVYAYRQGNELFVSKCSRTELFESAQKDVSELNRLKPNAKNRFPSTAKSNKAL